MKILKTSFKKRGWLFRQIRRKGRIACFEVKEGNKLSRSYEVIRIGSHNGFILAGIKLEASETYPSSNSWGSEAWTVLTKEKALQKFEELVSLKKEVGEV